jgi:hypothetical protein
MKTLTKREKAVLSVINKIFTKKLKYPHLSTINCGECWVWAIAAKRALPGAVVCIADNKHTGWGHAFIKYKGKYYDSEARTGKDHWLELRYFTGEYYSSHDYIYEERVREEELHTWSGFSSFIAESIFRACSKLKKLPTTSLRGSKCIDKYIQLPKDYCCYL